jgi:hypothetical protein
MSPSTIPGSAAGEPWIEITASRGFTGWLAAQKVSLAPTTAEKSG